MCLERGEKHVLTRVEQIKQRRLQVFLTINIFTNFLRILAASDICCEHSVSIIAYYKHSSRCLYRHLTVYF